MSLQVLLFQDLKYLEQQMEENNWIVVFEDSVPGHSFWDISFSDDLNGYAGGVGLISTSDGGTTWNKKFMPLLFCTNIRTIENQLLGYGFWRWL